jgi:hypothetical protein
MSGGPAAKVATGAARPPLAARAARTWSAPAPAPASTEPRIAAANDPAEAEADRMAERAVGGAARPPPPSRGAASPDGGGPLSSRIAEAGREARPLAPGDRAFFEPRFGHRFDHVRIHAGPSAAAAAAAARAQAFTLGRDIYFGAGEYHPGSQAGQGLLAHELAHTLQNRPKVIARRALDAPFSAPESEPGADAAPFDTAGDDMATLIETGQAAADGPTRDRLAGLDPAARTGALAALRARVPAADRSRVTALGESLPAGAGAGATSPPAATPNRMPEIRAAETPPAKVQPRDHAPGPPAPPTHQRAIASASARMQEATRALSAETPLEGAPALPGALDAPAAATAGEGGGSGGLAAAAAQDAVALISGQMAGLAGARGLAVRFQDSGGAGDPEAASRAMASQSLAAAFVGRAADRITAVLSSAVAVPGKLVGALGAATQAIAGHGAAQGAVVQAAADAARKQVRQHAARVHGAIATRQGETDRALSGDLRQARDRATRAHGAAADDLGRRAEVEKTRIALSYDNALQPMIGVGVEVGGLARDRARRRSKVLLDLRDGESSVLDGPLHDNQLEANAEACVKVGDAYAENFETTASQQADALPDSRPEVMAKVDEIAGQVRAGYSSQMAQIQQGADALDTGGAASSRQAATQMRAALDAQATQSRQAIDAVEQQQSAALQAQADAAAGAMDQSVAASLSAYSDGVAQAAGQLTGAIHSFVASAAEIPAPPVEDLSAALSDADPAPALEGMAAQIAAMAPATTGMLTEGQEASGAALAAAAQAGAQGLAGSAGAFALSAKGVGQQAAAGFHHLGQGAHRSADDLGKQAEAGFIDAATAADQAFAQFGDQVEDTFRTGRLQMHDGLWSAKNRVDLDAAMAKSGQEAADHVQPRWKKVLKWVVTIVVIVAVIAITVASAGALGPVGVVLLGAALGAAAGAVQTIANNLIDGVPWSTGVVKAMIVGAVGGAVGGAGGVLFKGVGTLALKVGLEAGVNVIGGVAGEALGSVATGEPVDWASALRGALVGAGIGAGLGFAGALRGRIRVGGLGEAAAPPPRPVIEPPPPAPAGRFRAALQAAKILAPRPGALPEGLVGAGAAGESTPVAETPVAKTPVAEAPPPKRLIGFGRGEAAPESPAAAAEAQKPRRPIGFDTGDPARETTAGPEAQRPRRLIGFGRGEAPPEPATSGPSPEAPQPPPPPRPIVIEGPPRASAPGGVEPIGGRSPLDIRASSEPAGGARSGRITEISKPAPPAAETAPRPSTSPPDGPAPTPKPRVSAETPESSTNSRVSERAGPAPENSTIDGVHRKPSVGATAEGEGAEFRYQYQPETPSPSISRGRGSGRLNSPNSAHSESARAESALAGESIAEASEGTADAARSPSAPDELNSADPDLVAELQGPEGPSEFSAREVWEPPAGLQRRPPFDAPIKLRRAWLKQRLEAHIDQAVERYQIEGLTPNQEAALVENPNLQPAYRGSRIDQFAKDSIMQDAELAEIITAPDFFNEPDILDTVLPDWFDITTRNAWADHLRTYATRYGTRAHLLDTHR